MNINIVIIMMMRKVIVIIIVCINKQKRLLDYWFCYSWWPKYNHQRTEKIWQVPGLKNRITGSLTCQGSGHTGSYRCSWNYVEENTSLYKTDWHPGRHIHPKNSYFRNSLYLTKNARHLRNWLDLRSLV